MIYLLDCSNFIKMKKNYGLQTNSNKNINPIINLKENKKFISTLKEIRAIIGMDSMLYIQIIGNKTEEIIKVVKLLNEYVGGSFYIKTTNNKQGIEAKEILLEEGIHIITTVIPIEKKLGIDISNPEYTKIKILESGNKEIYEKIISKLLYSSLSEYGGNSFISDWRKI